MKWSVIISGDKSILQTLSEISSIDDFKIEHKNGEFLMQSYEFEGYDSASDINRIASQNIELLNGIIFFKYAISAAIKIGGISKLNTYGGREIIVTLETEMLQIRDFKSTIIIKNDHETIISKPGQKILEQLVRIKSNSKASKIFRLLEMVIGNSRLCTK